MTKKEVLLCEIDEETGYLLGGSPIIHCKDCKYYIQHDHRCGKMNHGFKDDFYCAWGEREEDD